MAFIADITKAGKRASVPGESGTAGTAEISALPGVLLTAVIYPAGAVAGGIALGIGAIANDKKITDAGNGILQTTADISQAAIADPAASGEIIGGAAAVVVGAVATIAGGVGLVGVAGGVASIIAGATKLGIDTAQLEGKLPTPTTVGSVANATAQLATATQNAVSSQQQEIQNLQNQITQIATGGAAAATGPGAPAATATGAPGGIATESLWERFVEWLRRVL